MSQSLICFFWFLAIPVFVSSDNTTIVVSKDWSGNYSTILGAVSAIPYSSSITYTIYIEYKSSTFCSKAHQLCEFCRNQIPDRQFLLEMESPMMHTTGTSYLVTQPSCFRTATCMEEIPADSRDKAMGHTGIVIQNCTITAAPEIGHSNSSRAFPGRSCREYARTVVLESFLGDIVKPTGWSPWGNSSRLDLLSYIEYNNRGPGAEASGRVKWTSFQIITNSTQILQFTAKNFINASDCLPSIGIPFIPGLIGG
ncbi:pectinesterase 2-like [Cornus florida]|uniref:pectinesterase 2-like n=1 Tax=Cornus florida TaxID=4283 RepID=UPI0028988876|nr:pectinesterase 2-like [Cornus florida]